MGTIWELGTWIPSVSKPTDIQNAEILGQVEGRQSKGLVCGPHHHPVPPAWLMNSASDQCFRVVKCMSRRSGFGNLRLMQSSYSEGPLQEREGRLDWRRRSLKEGAEAWRSPALPQKITWGFFSAMWHEEYFFKAFSFLTRRCGRNILVLSVNSGLSSETSRFFFFLMKAVIVENRESISYRIFQCIFYLICIWVCGGMGVF